MRANLTRRAKITLVRSIPEAPPEALSRRQFAGFMAVRDKDFSPLDAAYKSPVLSIPSGTEPNPRPE